MTNNQLTSYNRASSSVIVLRSPKYDSRIGSHSYSMWTEGYEYALRIEEIQFVVGYRDYDHFSPFYGENTQDTSSWEEFPLAEIPKECQRMLAEEAGDLFPWELSSWGSREEFEEYYTPTTLEGRLSKACRSASNFEAYRSEYRSELEANAKVWQLGERPRGHWGVYIDELWLINDTYLRFRASVTPRSGHTTWLGQYSTDQALDLLKYEEEEKARKAREKKEFARECGRISRKFGVRFEIVLRCFKGDEEQIENFVESLKKAFDKEYDSYELSCGRARCRAEIEYLGIDIGYVDPNHIAGYVLECLQAGKILK